MLLIRKWYGLDSSCQVKLELAESINSTFQAGPKPMQNLGLLQCSCSSGPGFATVDADLIEVARSLFERQICSLKSMAEER